MTDPGEAGRIHAEDWWETSIIDMSPGKISLRGHPVESLIGKVGFPGMIWLMLRGELPNAEQEALLGAALAAAVDHGPQAPSIAIARMAITCGVGINGAMASAVNVLDDVHGGAGEQALELFLAVAARMDTGTALADAVSGELDARPVGYVPGYGHRFHPIDPRAQPLLDLVRKAAASGAISGRLSEVASALEAELGKRKGRTIPLNIDGATAVIYGELGFPPRLTRGLFVLSRSVGILAHAWEQSLRPERNKGPLPRDWRWTYRRSAPSHTED